LLLRAQQAGISPPILPLVWMSLHFSKVCSSIVFGNLSDKVGRKKLIFAGWILYALVYAGFAFVASAWQAWCLFLIYGLYFGLTEGSEKAMVADMVAEEKRGTAYGLYNLAILLLTVRPGALTTEQ
jgi:MFS family permease